MKQKLWIAVQVIWGLLICLGLYTLANLQIKEEFNNKGAKNYG